MSFEKYCDICFESHKDGCFSMSKNICRNHYNMNKEKIKSLESELERAKKELNLAKKVRSHLDQICDGTHEEVSCLIQIENERLKKENQELAAQHCSSAVLDEHGNRRCSQTGELI